MTAPLQQSIWKKPEPKICTDFLQTVQGNYILERHLMKWADINQKDSFGFTALYWAISHHNMYNVKLLMEYGATLEVTSTMNALFYTIDCDNLEALKYFLDKGIDKGITRRNHKGQTFTLLEHAKRLKRLAILEYLI